MTLTIEQLSKQQSQIQEEIQQIREELANGQADWILNAIKEGLSSISLVPIEQTFQVESEDFHVAAPTDVISYNAAAARAYAVTYCNQKTNSCGEFYADQGGDCAHFIGHCLAAGGIGVSGGDPKARCPHNIVKRAEELATALASGTRKYSNMQEISSYSQGQSGDYGFLSNFLRPSHAFMLNGTPTLTHAAAFAHTNPHCGDNMDSYRLFFGKYFRIL